MFHAANREPRTGLPGERTTLGLKLEGKEKRATTYELPGTTWRTTYCGCRISIAIFHWPFRSRSQART